jgi:hypothetical protein
MNFNLMQASTMAGALTAYCLLNGCACDCSKETVRQPVPSARENTGIQSSAVASDAPPLAYQWYFNTNGQEQIGAQTNGQGALLYQWYKGTNADEGAQH